VAAQGEAHEWTFDGECGRCRGDNAVSSLRDTQKEGVRDIASDTEAVKEQTVVGDRCADGEQAQANDHDVYEEKRS
jgi:hypothetical protein